MAKKPKCVLARRPCPENDDPAQGDYCPFWWGINEENDATGQVRTRKACGATYMPAFFVKYDAHMEEAAQSVQSNRNETARGLAAIREETVQGFQRVGAGIGTLLETVDAAQRETRELVDGVQRRLPAEGREKTAKD